MMDMFFKVKKELVFLVLIIKTYKKRIKYVFSGSGFTLVTGCRSYRDNINYTVVKGFS